jgi:hypothetical protein
MPCTLIYYVVASGDGFIAGPGGEIDIFRVPQVATVRELNSLDVPVPTRLAAEILRPVPHPPRAHREPRPGRGTVVHSFARG